jgi:hypothetical protein
LTRRDEAVLDTSEWNDKDREEDVLSESIVERTELEALVDDIASDKAPDPDI